MNDLREVLDKYNLTFRKITLINGVRIIDTETGRYVLKKNSNQNIGNTYRYLKSRSFDYFPDKINDTDDYDIYEYVEDIDEPSEQKMLDLIYLVALLHLKTTYYKEVDIDDYKKIYESVNEQLDDVLKYYNNVMDAIESNVYFSPSQYLIARNVSKVYESLNYAKENIDKWYQLIKEKNRQRVVNIHNNLSLSHYLKGNKPYLISWEKSKVDMPIYDLLNLYNNHYLDIDFNDIFLEYEKRYPLLEEERILLFTLMAIPKKIINKESNYELCIEIRKVFDYIYKTERLITEYRVAPSPH